SERPGCTPLPASQRAAGSGRGRRAGRQPVRRRSSLLGPLHVGDHLLATARTRDDLDELPPVVAPVVQDLLGRVDQERDGDVLPFLHAPSVTARTTPRLSGGGATLAEEPLALELVEPTPDAVALFDRDGVVEALLS